ncbi:MAG TPA: hypothetical protein V6C91_23120, partial [Coleofasciculaceae cyanobacterium]
LHERSRQRSRSPKGFPKGRVACCAGSLEKGGKLTEFGINPRKRDRLALFLHKLFLRVSIAIAR